MQPALVFIKWGGVNANLQFLLGRMLGYALLGAISAMLVSSVAWLSENTAVFRPLWAFTHVAIFAWGLMMLMLGKQPIWVEHAGGRLWQIVQRISQLRMGIFITGVLWALMPCGLLYSALLISSLVANPLHGAFNMLMFATGSAISLLVIPWFWTGFQQHYQYATDQWGMRIAGLLLLSVSAWAIWMDVMHQTKYWCVV